MAETAGSKTVVTKKKVARRRPVESKAPTKQEEHQDLENVTDTQDLASLQSQLEKVQKLSMELEQKIQATRRLEMRAFCTSLRKHIKESGHDIDDILDELNRRRARRVPHTTSVGRRTLSKKVMAYNDNPSLTYIRGVMPEWMRNAMREKGYDTKKANDRRRFRTEQMHEVDPSNPTQASTDS